MARLSVFLYNIARRRKTNGKHRNHFNNNHSNINNDIYKHGYKRMKNINRCINAPHIIANQTKWKKSIQSLIYNLISTLRTCKERQNDNRT